SGADGAWGLDGAAPGPRGADDAARADGPAPGRDAGPDAAGRPAAGYAAGTDAVASRLAGAAGSAARLRALRRADVPAVRVRRVRARPPRQGRHDDRDPHARPRVRGPAGVRAARPRRR